jgi:hypothetical protein
LAPELKTELDCPDFKEKKAFENFLRIFKRERITYFDKATHKLERKKKSFFRRLFGTK